MNEGLNKFAELLKTDEEFQKKLKAAMEAYDGEKTEEAVFNQVLVPVAAEYGVSATYEELKDYMQELNSKLGEDQDLSLDELDQVAGGKNGVGLSILECVGLGFGFGGGVTTESGGVCAVLGLGYGGMDCIGLGES